MLADTYTLFAVKPSRDYRGADQFIFADGESAVALAKDDAFPRHTVVVEYEVKPIDSGEVFYKPCVVEGCSEDASGWLSEDDQLTGQCWDHKTKVSDRSDEAVESC
jgi:hypothetical protein